MAGFYCTLRARSLYGRSLAKRKKMHILAHITVVIRSKRVRAYASSPTCHLDPPLPPTHAHTNLVALGVRPCEISLSHLSVTV